jgi:proteasome beta subunit
VLCLRYKDGILNLGDRRATAANYIMYDRAKKILRLDDHTLIAISGSFARSTEIARYLRHAFKYYSRTQLQDMSVEGKLQEVSRALAGNLSMSLNGIGVFLPIVSAYDPASDSLGIYFYDVMGARFESGQYGCAGSGSDRIRGVFEYIQRHQGNFEERALDDVLIDGLTMLDIASKLDSATGNLSMPLPIAMTLTKHGIEDIDEELLHESVLSVQKR